METRDREQELAELTTQIRAERARLAGLQATAEAMSPPRDEPFIGHSFVLGLVLGFPLWTVAGSLYAWWGR